MPLANCRECGRLYQQLRDKLCPECKKTREEEVDKVKKYLRKNPGASIPEASEETKIEEERILDFIRDGDIELIEAPSELSFMCEVCGKPIPHGRKCSSCQDKFVNQFKKVVQKYEPTPPQTPRKNDRSVHSRMYTADIIKKKSEEK